jgi:hypothetical protein
MKSTSVIYIYIAHIFLKLIKFIENHWSKIKIKHSQPIPEIDLLCTCMTQLFSLAHVTTPSVLIWLWTPRLWSGRWLGSLAPLVPRRTAAIIGSNSLFHRENSLFDHQDRSRATAAALAQVARCPSVRHVPSPPSISWRRVPSVRPSVRSFGRARVRKWNGQGQRAHGRTYARTSTRLYSCRRRGTTYV